MIHLLHRWGRWQDAEITLEAGPLGRWIGLPDSRQAPAQFRTCSKCGLTKVRRLS